MFAHVNVVMDRDERDRDTEDPAVVSLQGEAEVDWLAEGRRDRFAAYETGAVVRTPDGTGTIIARFVHDQPLDGREVTAGPDSPTYLVQRPDTEEPHPTYDEAALTPVED